MPALDVFSLPSRYEGFPYVLLESMAAGLPVVTTCVGGTHALVADGGNGFVVPPNDPVGLAGALETVLADEDLRRNMGQESVRRVQQYSIANMVSKTLDVYETLLGHHVPMVRGAVVPSPRLGGAPSWGHFRKTARSVAHHVAAALSVSAHAMLSDRSHGALGILLYHRVVQPVPGVAKPTSNVVPRRFRAQLEGLLSRGYQAWPLAVCWTAIGTPGPFPPRCSS